jgi:hypothetical protein
MSDYPDRVHLKGCRKESVRLVELVTGTGPTKVISYEMKCDCGFAAWLAAQDHSKNVRCLTDKSVPYYDVLELRAAGLL